MVFEVKSVLSSWDLINDWTLHLPWDVCVCAMHAHVCKK